MISLPKQDLVNLTSNHSDTIDRIIHKMNKSGKKIIFIIKNKKLVGSISDGDIRRAILKFNIKNTKVTKIMNRFPVYINNKELSKHKIKLIMKKKNVNQIPVVNKKKEILNIFFYEEISKNQEIINNKQALILAGGYGKRLLPLTKTKPKPLIEISKTPIIFNIIRSLISHNYNKIFISTFYLNKILKKKISENFSDKINIVFIDEKKRLGTAGCLSLINILKDDNLLIINSDILTNLDFNSFEKFHKKNKYFFSICVNEVNFNIPYGVISKKNNKIFINEKPVLKNYVAAGIYYSSGLIRKYIKKNKKIDMPDLINKICSIKKKVGLYYPYEIIHDIGTYEQLEQAKKIVNDNKSLINY